jgi:hypothetical protein
VVHYDTTVDSVASGTTVVDISGNGINGTLTNGAVYSSSERALKFDGVNDIVSGTFPSSSGDNTLSVSCWVKRTVGAAVSCPFFIGDAATGEGIGLDLYNSSDTYWFIFGGKNFSFPGKTDTFFPVGRWTHVVATHIAGADFANLNKLWINGVDVTSQGTFSGTGDLTLDTYDTITLGARVNANYLNGSISNFKLWGGVALTAEEVAAEYALGRTGKSLNVTDTAVCLGGTVPRAQLDVRGTGMFDGGLVIKVDNTEYARDGGITLSRAGLGTAANKYSSQPIVLDGGDAGAVDANIRGGAIWSQWGGAQYGIAMKGANYNNTYPYLQTPTMFVTNDKVGIGVVSPNVALDVSGQAAISAGLTYVQKYNATINSFTAGNWYDIGDFSGMSNGTYLLTVIWGNDNNLGYYWYGGASGIVYIRGDAGALYDLAPGEYLTLSHWYHHRTVNQFDFLFDSDQSSSNPPGYGNTTLFVKGYPSAPININFTTRMTLLSVA